MARRRIPAIVGLLLLAPSCGSDNTTEPPATESPSTPPPTTADDAAADPAVTESPSTPPATTTDDAVAEAADSPMSVAPAEAMPGTEVELVYDPPDTERGTTFTFEIAADGGWRATHLMATGYDDVDPATAPIDTDNFGGEDLTRRALESDRVVIPLDAPPGPARICGDSIRLGFCAELEILGDS